MPTTIKIGKVCYTPKGQWIAGTYAKLDLVTDKGNTYGSKKDANNALLTDATSWDLINGGGVYLISKTKATLTETVAGNVLDATMGKTLADADSAIISNMNNTFEGIEQPIADALNTLLGRIKSLEEFITNMTIDTAQIDYLNVVKTFNIFDGTNLILKGTAAPSVVPDFVGQQFVNTTAKTTYVATGNASVGDWKQTNNA